MKALTVKLCFSCVNGMPVTNASFWLVNGRFIFTFAQGDWHKEKSILSRMHGYSRLVVWKYAAGYLTYLNLVKGVNNYMNNIWLLASHWITLSVSIDLDIVWSRIPALVFSLNSVNVVYLWYTLVHFRQKYNKYSNNIRNHRMSYNIAQFV